MTAALHLWGFKTLNRVVRNVISVLDLALEVALAANHGRWFAHKLSRLSRVVVLDCMDGYMGG